MFADQYTTKFKKDSRNRMKAALVLTQKHYNNDTDLFPAKWMILLLTLLFFIPIFPPDIQW